MKKIKITVTLKEDARYETHCCICGGLISKWALSDDLDVCFPCMPHWGNWPRFERVGDNLERPDLGPKFRRMNLVARSALYHLEKECAKKTA